MKGNIDSKSAVAAEINRREFLVAGTGAAVLGVLGLPRSSGAATRSAWNAGKVTHLIPMANHEHGESVATCSSFAARASSQPLRLSRTKPARKNLPESEAGCRRTRRFHLATLNPMPARPRPDTR